MRKTNLIKALLVLVMGVVLVLFSTSVLAADDGYTELTLNNTSNTNTNTNTNRANTNTNLVNNTVNTNSSIYNNTNLPKTGIEDSIPVALLVTIFGISSVYAYKKIKEYRNI